MRLISLAICIALSVSARAQTKRALLVAISEYDDFRSWKRISSVEDLPYIRAGLKQFGFDNKDIDSLKNAQATKANILAALDGLARRSAPGDIVVFFFCGHGQQVMDNNGEPDEFDGFDEALVPYEAPGQYDPVSNTGQLHLRDDELFPKLKAIDDKVGSTGNFLVMIDACHSGTATRADAFMIARGSARPLAPDDYKPEIRMQIRPGGFSDDRQLPNTLLMSASGPDQLNYQTVDDRNKPVGVLSYAFAKACFELKPGDSYQLMFEKIKARIQSNKPTQVPMLEGNGKLQVFSAKFASAEDVVSVNQSQWLNDTSFIVNRGYLHDITSGSKFHLSALGAIEVVTHGYIARVEAMQSVGVVEHGVDKKSGYAFKLDELVPAELHSTIFISNKGKDQKKGERLKGEVEKRMVKYPWVRQGNPADMMLEISGDSVQLVDNGGRVMVKDNCAQGMTDDQWKRIMEKVNADTRIRYLRDLPDGGTLAADVLGEVISESRLKDSIRNEFVFEANDQFRIGLQNKGEKALFFNLVNITPDNEVKLLLPAPGINAGNCQLRPGVKYSTPLLKISPGTPRGKEVFKVILSEQEFDLGPVISRMKGVQRSQPGPLGKLFNDIYADSDDQLVKKRSVGSVPIDKMGVITIGYSVK